MTTVIEIQPTATAAVAARSGPTTWRQAISAVPTHQALAVVCALVCFAPLGVAAVVCAGNVRTRLALGDLEGARRASRMALRLCWASAVVTMFFLAGDRARRGRLLRRPLTPSTGRHASTKRAGSASRTRPSACRSLRSSMGR